MNSSKFLRRLMPAVVLLDVWACGNDAKTSPFPIATAKLYGTVSTGHLSGPPFRLQIRAYHPDCSLFVGEIGAQTDSRGNYGVSLVATTSETAACLRATVFSVSGADSATILVSSIHLTPGQIPADSQRVDIAVP